MELLWTGFLLGFLGSFHCAGMCGPLVMALPGSTQNRFNYFTGRLFYNLGRICTYALFGMFFGLFGMALNLTGLQQTISIISGVLILLFILLPTRFTSRLGNYTGLNVIVFKVKGTLVKAFKLKGHAALFMIGLLNGVLPCGFVYLALAAAISAPSVWLSAVYMSLFGFGTFPLMMLIALSGKVISTGFRNRINKSVPYIAGVVAVLFILRGLSLGIPYISPKMDTNTLKNMSCH